MQLKCLVIKSYHSFAATGSTGLNPIGEQGVLICALIVGGWDAFSYTDVYLQLYGRINRFEIQAKNTALAKLALHVHSAVIGFQNSIYD